MESGSLETLYLYSYGETLPAISVEDLNKFKAFLKIHLNSRPGKICLSLSEKQKQSLEMTI